MRTPLAVVSLAVFVACSGGSKDDDPLTTDSGPTTTGTDPLERVDDIVAIDGDPAEGEALFQSTCASCHGSYGEGTDSGRQLLGVGFDEETVVSAVLTGVGTMPSYSTFTDQQVADVYAYLYEDILFESTCRGVDSGYSTTDC